LDRKINVLHASNALEHGGTEKGLQLTVENLDKKVFSPFVAGLQRGGSRADALRKEGYPVLEATGDPAALEEFARRNKIKIFHIYRAGWPNRAEDAFISAARRAGVPIVVETSAFGGVDDTATGRGFDFQIFTSIFSGHRWMKWTGTPPGEFFKKRLSVYSPVDTATYCGVKPQEVDAFKKRLGIRKGEFVIGRISRKDASKWESMPFEAFEILAKKLPDVRFVASNTPDEARKRMEKSPFADRIVFAGYLAPKELPLLYASFDVFAYASRIGESFGYVLAEAMASARPIVVNSTPLWDDAQIELVDHGRTGFVANSAGAMADAILELYNDPGLRRRMGEAARRKAVERYDAARITRTIERIYAGLLRKKGIGLPPAAAKIEKYPLFPSRDEIRSFAADYKKRLFSYYGRRDYGYEVEAHAFDRLDNRQFHRYAKGVLRYLRLRKV
jgi:glycosyltransferase involved in cell wall biosynthesis